MKNVIKRKPSDYVAPRLGPERTERMWQVIEAHERERVHTSAQPRVLVWAVAAALALGYAGWLERARFSPSPVAAGSTLSADKVSSTLVLADGSTLELAHDSKVSVLESAPNLTRLRLVRGSLRCAVAPRTNALVVVEANNTRLESHPGTTLRVELAAYQSEPARALVRVERGSVLVETLDRVPLATLPAGAQWPASAPRPESAAKTSEATPVSEPTAVDDHALPARNPRPQHEETAAELLTRAGAARVAGKAAEAEKLYERLCSHFPGDTRVGLAAFELSRIRLDALHDARGALAALRIALAHPDGFAREDAEALRIDAFAQSGDVGACREARRQFLSAHPESAHVARIQRACRE